ncbi:MAG: TonB-dependent receptor [Tannerella sp.]|jgi:hypothetical protein|nr:TonB-dependent receptor [Tannerella sp.]
MLRRRHLLFLFFTLLLSVPVFGQVEIRGTVIEQSSKEPVEQATIRLLNAKDSVFVQGVASSKNGSFSLKNVKAGNYLLQVTFIGYETVWQSLQVTGRTNPVSLAQIELVDESILLDEASVTGKAPEVKVQNDTIIYNADSYKVAEGSVLEDLLKKMPGVEVDTEGKVTVNGKEIKKIMVDGKEFFSDDPKVASRNLPAKMVDKLEVWDKKSDMALMTGFDDGEEETVINLTVKPGMKAGWFGNAFAGYGSQERYEGNFMVNRFINNDQFTIMGGINNTNNMGFSDLASTMFSGMGGGRRGFGGFFGGGNGITSSGNIGTNFSKSFTPKLTLGGNVRYSHSDNFAESKDNNQLILPGDSASFDISESSRNTVNDNFGVNLRMEWKPDDRTQVIFRPDFSYSKTHRDETENSHSENGRLAGALDSVNRASSRSASDGEGYNSSFRLEFSRKLSDDGRVLSGSLSGGINDSYSNGIDWSKTDYLLLGDSSDIIDQQVRYDNSSVNYRAFLSWVEPLGHNNFIQATYSFSRNNRESLKNSYNNDGQGNYTVLDSTYSQSTRNYSTQQRARIAFKSVRGKYDYMLGFNFDPSYMKTETFVGDHVLYSNSRNVMNYSPFAQLNYRFTPQTFLRINYDGDTDQPSMQQLQPVADISDPLNMTIGNPDLKPTYSNDIRIQFNKFVPEQQTAFIVFADGGYTINDIVTKSTFDAKTNKRVTTYENVNGNYRGNLRLIVNTPLKNKKFSINTMTFAMYSNSNGFINEQKNTNKNLSLMERAGIDYRSDYFDFGVNANIRYQNTRNSLQGQQNLNTLNYGGGVTTSIYLPYNFRIESDITYSTNSGYTSGFEQKEWLWNASVSKSLLKGNAGTIRLKMYDILQQRSNISYSVSSSNTRYSEYNTLKSYFMVHFIYRFSIFKGGASESDMRRGGPGGPPPGGSGRRPGFGG